MNREELLKTITSNDLLEIVKKLKNGDFSFDETNEKVEMINILNPEASDYIYWNDELTEEEIVEKILGYSPNIIIANPPSSKK